MESSNLQFTKQGQARLEEVRAFLSALPETGQSGEIKKEFNQTLAYLNRYGGDRYKVSLHADRAPLSFALVWSRLNQETGEYEYSFRGGLIWHGGSNDPLTVSVSPQWWGIHT